MKNSLESGPKQLFLSPLPLLLRSALLHSLLSSSTGCTWVVAQWRDEQEIGRESTVQEREQRQWRASELSWQAQPEPQLQLQLQMAQTTATRAVLQIRRESHPTWQASATGLLMILGWIGIGLGLDALTGQLGDSEELGAFTAIGVVIASLDAIAAIGLFESETLREDIPQGEWVPGPPRETKAYSNAAVTVSAPQHPWRWQGQTQAKGQLLIPLQHIPQDVLNRDPLILELQSANHPPLQVQLKNQQLFALRKAFPERFEMIPARLSWQIRFQDQDGDQRLMGEETGTFEVQVHNHGPGRAYGLQLQLQAPPDYLRWASEPLEIGGLEAGASTSVSVPIKALAHTPAGQATLTLSLQELNGFEPRPLRIELTTTPFQAPALQLQEYQLQDKSGDGRIEPLEMVTATLRIVNRGPGAAEQVEVRLDLPAHVFAAAESPTRFELGRLGPGETRDLHTLWYTNNRAQGTLEIPVMITEKLGRYGSRTPVQMALSAPPGQTLLRIQPQPQVLPSPPAESLGIDVEMRVPRTQNRSDGVAVLIGNRDYRHAPSVDFAVRDLEVMRLYLTQVLGYKPENILAYPNATKADLDLLFGTRETPAGKLADWLKADQPVFVYYSGHGAPDSSGGTYLVPVDADPAYLVQTGYPLQSLYNNLSRLPYTDLTLVIDACFSGQSPRGALLPQRSPLLLEARYPTSPLPRAVVLQSSGPRELSTWYADKRHSLFTYFVLKGLQGAADSNQDKVLTAQELSRYLQEQVPYLARRLHGQNQQPQAQGDLTRVLVRY